MNSESLYEQFKWKQLHEKQMQQHELARIQTLSNEPKININSACILLKRTIQILDQFPDDDLINLQTSIPLLQAVNILQILNSVSEAKQKLSEGLDPMQSRLKHEAQFLYYLWNMIDEQEIECRELKQLVGLLQSKKKHQLKFILSQMYPDQDKVQQLIRAWTILCANQQYYKYASKSNASQHQSNKQNASTQELLPYSHYSKRDKSGQLGSPIYQKSKSNNKLPNGMAETHQNFYPTEFGYTCQLSNSQEKQLIERLYKNNIYKQREEQKKQQEQKRQEMALKECTFKPNLIKRGKSASCKNHSQIKGYDKAINRMKAGTQKNKISKEMRDYKPIGENYDKLKQKGINPPKFLQRKKKQQQKVLFIISFDLGRHKTNVKIRQNDTEDSVAQRICKIYSLKKEFYEQIKQIVKNQLDAYYQELQQFKGEGTINTNQMF